MLTVFTPVYNRAETLTRLYESLQKQTCTDFEWLIIDDGSTDDTPKLAQSFLWEPRFPVRYQRKENGGKHTAHNLALTLAQGTWFLCVDSDDYLTQDAVQTLTAELKDLQPNRGIIAYKQDVSGKRLSREFPEDLQYSYMNELIIEHGCAGEFTLIFPTALVREYPFPVFPGERFVTESVVYDQIDRNCRMLLLPKVITVCEYQPDGYSQNVSRLMATNPCGYSLYFMQRVDVSPSWKGKIVSAGKYWCFRWRGRNCVVSYTGKHKLLTGLGIPLGMIFHIYYKWVRKF